MSAWQLWRLGAAIAQAVRAERVQRALAHAEERWRVAREVKRGRWGDR